MKRRLWILGVAVLMMMISGTADAENPKIAYVDAQKVLDGTKAGRRSKSLMEEYVKSRQKIIDLDESDIRQLEEELSKQTEVLSPEAKREKQEALGKKMSEYQRKVAELNKEVQAKKKEILGEFQKGLQAAVQRVAEKKGYLMVLDRETDGGTLLYAAAALDITDEVIKEYDSTVSEK
jgi:outer membrane protein